MKKFSLFLALVLLVTCISLVPASADEPIVIQFWHARGSGTNLDSVTQQIETFNATIGAEKGIIVEGTYQGAYGDVLTKAQLGVSSGEGPQVAQIERSNVVTMYLDDMLYDMNEFIERDNFDLGNIFDVFVNTNTSWDGHRVAMPYTRSIPVFYYNKGMCDAKGLTAPKTIEELEQWARALTVVNDAGETEIYGFELHFDFPWFNQNMLVQMGSNLFNPTATACPALEDGTMLTMLTAWRKWIDDGWCRPFAATDGENEEKQQFYLGKLGGFIASSGGLAGVIDSCKEAGIELGVAPLPTWGIEAYPVGGANVCILKPFCKNEAEASAAWEFVKFLVSDEQQALEMKTTGYAAVNKKSGDTDVLKQLFVDHPEYAVVYYEMQYAQDIPTSEYRSEFVNAIKPIASMLIQENSITPEEAVEQMKEAAADIFP